jgi:hypothetical protein
MSHLAKCFIGCGVLSTLLSGSAHSQGTQKKSTAPPSTLQLPTTTALKGCVKIGNIVVCNMYVNDTKISTLRIPTKEFNALVKEAK